MIPRAVLVRLSALGDIVHAWPLAAELKAQRLVGELCWVVEAPFRALVEDHPAVDRVIAVDTRRWRRRWFSAAVRQDIRAARNDLRSFGADVCLDPQGVLKSALVAAQSRAERRIGLPRRFRRERLAGLAYTETVTLPPAARHVIDRNLRFTEPLGGVGPQAPAPPDGRWLLSHEPSTAPVSESPPTVIVPGSGGRSKVVDASVWSEVARRLAEDGHRVVVAWGPNEHERALSIAESSGVAIAPPTDLLQLAELLGGAALVLGGDTGPVHLAVSLGTPTVAVFLTTDPERNRPLGRHVGVVSCVEPAVGPTRSAAARRTRSPSAEEIVRTALDLPAAPDR